MSLQNIFKDIPNNGFFLVNEFPRRLNRFYDTSFNEFTNDEWLEKFSGHVLRKTTFMQSQFRTNHDYRTTGVVNTLTEEDLTEAALLTLEYIGERSQCPSTFSLHGVRLPRVVEEAVDRFLEHTLLIAQDHLRSLDFEKALETIVTNDHTTIEVVEIGRSEAAAIEGNEGTQFRRNNRNVLHDHPLG